jgi:hypothetical protein
MPPANSTPKGIEDVGTYPYLFAELMGHGWSAEELVKLAGGNLLRVFSEVTLMVDGVWLLWSGFREAVLGIEIVSWSGWKWNLFLVGNGREVQRFDWKIDSANAVPLPWFNQN